MMRRWKGGPSLTMFTMFAYSQYLPWWWLLPVTLSVLFLASLPLLPYADRHRWKLNPSLVLAALTVVSFVFVIIASFHS
jgi:hypothetical protein